MESSEKGTERGSNLLIGLKSNFIKDAEIKKIKERHSPSAKKLQREFS